MNNPAPRSPLPLPGTGIQEQQRMPPVSGIGRLFEKNVKITYVEGEVVRTVAGNMESVGPFISVWVAGGTLTSIIAQSIITIEESVIQIPAIGKPAAGDLN